MKAKRSGSGAFTLAEIMIVIVVIGVLMAFLLPSILKSREAAVVAKARMQMSALGMSIDQFQDDFGYYPPTDNAFNPATGQFDGDPYGDYGYSEALVHCLCNRFTKGTGDALSGVDLSHRGRDRLVGGAPVTAGPYYEVDKDSLTDLDSDGFYELADPWGNPYVYVPKDDYLDAAGTGYNAGALLKNSDGSDPDPTILTTDTPPLNDHHQRFKFQLISRGRDGWTPGIDTQDADGDTLPDGYKDISITGNPYGGSPFMNPALIGTDTDPAGPRLDAALGHTEETADDLNNWD